MKREAEEEAGKECTFAPIIDKRSERMMTQRAIVLKVCMLVSCLWRQPLCAAWINDWPQHLEAICHGKTSDLTGSLQLSPRSDSLALSMGQQIAMEAMRPSRTCLPAPSHAGDPFSIK